MFKNFYHKKKVLITGNTGFKGSWLTTWLMKLGANVVGISIDIPTVPSMFNELKLEEKINYYKEDARDLEKITQIILNEKPDIIFHLAAQPIVSISYTNPIETISSNVIGTTNILEALRKINPKCLAVIITSDKVYNNIEQTAGYKENDKIGGKDIYSGSKGAAEIIINSYFHSYFKKDDCNVRLATARAGNVIGGGDWADSRIVVDCMNAWSKGEIVEIRAPNATRPWQHVLEPLSGYLDLAADLSVNHRLHGEAFNFGPKPNQDCTVVDLISELSKYWDFKNLKDAYTITSNIKFHEAKLLKLNCDKALFHLKWEANLDFKKTVELTSEWYYNFYKTENKIFDKTLEQITEYENFAKEKKLKWTE